MKTHLVIFTVLILFFSCNNPSQHKKEAERYFNEKKYEHALIEINKAIESEPDSISHYTLRCLIFDFTGRYKEEISDLGKIIELNKKRNSKSVNAHHQRAVAQIQLGLYNEALLDIDYFIDNRDTVGSLIKAYLNKASILYKLNDYKNSVKYYELVLKENNGKENSIESQALVGLANLSKSPKDALILLNKAILIDDSCVTAYGARGSIYIDLEKIDLAYDDFLKGISINNPNEIDISTLHFNMGQLFANYKNNNDSAAKYFENAIKLSPQSPNNGLIYMNLGVIKNREGKLDEALIDFQNAVAIDSKNDLILFNFAYLLSDLKRNTEALDKISKAIIINSSDADYFNLKGSILLDLSSFNEAEKEFKKALEINPNFGTAFYNLGYLFGEQNDHEQSIKYYDKAVLLNYDLEATLVNRALQKIEINQTSSACIDLEKAYKLGRTDIKPLIDKYCN